MSVRVVARVRPKTYEEQKQQQSLSNNISLRIGNASAGLTIEEKSRIYLRNELISSKALCYEFDRVFDEFSNQQDVFVDTADDLVRSTIEGYNASIFAYGPSGTGKTHTMLGTDLWSQATNGTTDSISFAKKSGQSDARGVIPRSMEALMQEVKENERKSNNSIITKLKCSYFEIYNEKIFDLLNYESSKAIKGGLDIREDKKTLGNNGVFVVDATQIEVCTLDEVFELLWKGARNRAVSATEVNEHSSRSHTIFQVIVEQYSSGPNQRLLKRAKLNLVDLAGSEKWRSHQLGEFSEKRIQEMTSINQSLSNLGNCVRGLLQPNRSHIPFRNSKLTRLLQDSLGGNCKTCFIVTASPSELAVEETMSTFQFANRVKQVAVHATINDEVDESTSYIRKLEAEIKQLKDEIANIKRDPSPVSSPSSASVRSSQESSVSVKSFNEPKTQAGGIISQQQQQLNVPLQTDKLEQKQSPSKPLIRIDTNTNSAAAISPLDSGLQIAESLPPIQKESAQAMHERRKRAMDRYHAWLLRQEGDHNSMKSVSFEERLTLMEWSVYFQRDEYLRMKRLHEAEINALKLTIDSKDAEIRLLKAQLLNPDLSSRMATSELLVQPTSNIVSSSVIQTNKPLPTVTSMSEYQLPVAAPQKRVASTPTSSSSDSTLPSSQQLPVKVDISQQHTGTNFISIQRDEQMPPIHVAKSDIPIQRSNDSQRMLSTPKLSESSIDMKKQVRTQYSIDQIEFRDVPMRSMVGDQLPQPSSRMQRQHQLENEEIKKPKTVTVQDSPPNSQSENKNNANLMPSTNKPTPWRSYIDKASGKPYYYNKITKETTWIKPKDFIEASNQTNASNESYSQKISASPAVGREGVHFEGSKQAKLILGNSSERKGDW